MMSSTPQGLSSGLFPKGEDRPRNHAYLRLFFSSPSQQDETKNNDGDKDDIVNYQANTSANLPSSSSPCTSNTDFVQHQKQVFDTMSDWFADRSKEITPELEPVYQQMASHMMQNILSQYNKIKKKDNEEEESPTTLRILDVACGTGVLWEFLLQAAASHSVKLEITGVDLSSKMVEKAKTREYPGDDYSLRVVNSEIVEYCQSLDSDSNPFDAVLLNACFGNFWDPRQVLEALPSPSTIIISHPLQAAFVEKLHQDSPDTVPHVLPSSTLDVVQSWTLGLPIVPTDFCQEPYYAMTLWKDRARTLDRLQRYRGKVDNGYGRGGKQLGVPTANLPSSLFQNALSDVDVGVYFGWASLEHLAPGQIFKAVVNVGYSPTFQGKENKEKIIEAHLILDNNEKEEEPLEDFYGQTMRLQLLGFLRPEQKFESFSALVTQIHADIRDSAMALDCSPYVELKQDVFLDVSENWNKGSNDNNEAGWEFVDLKPTLESLSK